MVFALCYFIMLLLLSLIVVGEGYIYEEHISGSLHRIDKVSCPQGRLLVYFTRVLQGYRKKSAEKWQKM